MIKRAIILVILLSAVLECNHLWTVDRLLCPEKFNKKALYSYILLLGIQYPDIVYAQAKIESANFRSKLFKSNNNLFGMRYAGKKKSVATGVKKGYSVYNNWKGSVMDYKLWQDRMIHRIDNEREYLLYLQEHYAEDSTYIMLIKKMK